MFGKLIIFSKTIALVLSLSFWRLKTYFRALCHRSTYEAVGDPRNVVVIGGSFAGYFLAEYLAGALPTGWRVVLIEKHSHFLFTWIFPRISVVSGHDHKAFIPYTQRPANAPEGAYLFRQGRATDIKDNFVILEDGEQIAFEYLAIATGSQGRYPSALTSIDKQKSIAFFQERQRRVRKAHSIVIIGGGPAGVELAADIKSKYPEKDVTLLHSRERLLGNFGIRLHDAAVKALKDLGVKVCFNERISIENEDDQPGEILLTTGEMIKCDLTIKCVGQRSASELISKLSPSSVSPSGTILVNDHLQIMNIESSNLYALGDVAETDALKMGRSASLQAPIVCENIVRSIKGQSLVKYHSSIIDRSIELTLGLKTSVLYLSDGHHDLTLSRKSRDETLHVEQMWKMLGAQAFQDPTENSNK